MARDSVRAVAPTPVEAPAPGTSRPLPVSLAGELTPAAVMRLQGAVGNAAVGQLLRRPATPGRRQLARLRTATQFKKRSDMFGHGRSQALQDIDASLAAYDVARPGTPDAREAALYDLMNKIGSWKQSKQTAADNKAWTTTARAKYITELELQQQVELNLVIALKNQAEQDRQAAALKLKQDTMDAMITPRIAAMTNTKAKARALFRAYMAKFRGQATYTTTTPKNTTVWDMTGGRVACAMISNGLIDLLRHAGLTAKLRKVDPENFVTKKVGADFIDPSTEGNVRLPGGTFADEKRFFFNKHWIVSVGNGTLYLDATSGIEVDKDATQIIEYGPMVSENATPPVFSDNAWRATHIGNNRLADGSYSDSRRLSPAGPPLRSRVTMRLRGGRGASRCSASTRRAGTRSRTRRPA